MRPWDWHGSTTLAWPDGRLETAIPVGGDQSYNSKERTSRINMNSPVRKSQTRRKKEEKMKCEGGVEREGAKARGDRFGCYGGVEWTLKCGTGVGRLSVWFALVTARDPVVRARSVVQAGFKSVGQFLSTRDYQAKNHWSGWLGCARVEKREQKRRNPSELTANLAVSEKTIGVGNPKNDLKEGKRGRTVKILANQKKHKDREDDLTIQRAGIKGTGKVTVGREEKEDRMTHGDAWENTCIKSKERTRGRVVSEEKPRNPRKESCALSMWTGKGEEKHGGAGVKLRNNMWQPGLALFKGDLIIRRALFSVIDEGQLEDKRKGVSEREEKGKDQRECQKGKRIEDEEEGKEGLGKGKESEGLSEKHESEGKKGEKTVGKMPQARTTVRMSTAGGRARGVQLPEILNPEEAHGKGEENAAARVEKGTISKEVGVGSSVGIKQRVKQCCPLDKGPPCFKAIREANERIEQDAKHLAKEEARRQLEEEACREKEKAKGKQGLEIGYPRVLPQYSKMSVCPNAPMVPFRPPPVKIEEIMPPRKPMRMPHGPENDVLEVDPEEFMEELNKLQARRAEEIIHVIVEGMVLAGFVIVDWICATLAYHDMLVTIVVEDVKHLGEKCYNVVIKDERA
ncbi:hypothetical protein SELMODRAFT_431570 [Selaginella moellendorffii]|uniref:Uncharacterized protein n=1 Tax=Selaginella moellendorffii TaxID=88036 RepID=D8TD31_SELML|nr:hypothetical protein SELMODRAFT_431570 [Selaginella moellendorffii]